MKERDYTRLREVLKGFGETKPMAGFVPRFTALVHEVMKNKTKCYDIEEKLDKLIEALSDNIEATNLSIDIAERNQNNLHKRVTKLEGK